MPESKKKDLINRTIQNYYEHEFVENELRKNVRALRKSGITSQEILDNQLKDVFEKFSE